MVQIQRITAVIISFIFLLLLLLTQHWFTLPSLLLLWLVVVLATGVSLYYWRAGTTSKVYRLLEVLLFVLFFLFPTCFVDGTGGLYSLYFPLLFIFPLAYSAMMRGWRWFFTTNLLGALYTIYLFVATGDPSANWLNIHIILQYSVMFAVSGLILYFNIPCLHCDEVQNCGMHADCPVEWLEDLSEGGRM